MKGLNESGCFREKETGYAWARKEDAMEVVITGGKDPSNHRGTSEMAIMV